MTRPSASTGKRRPHTPPRGLSKDKAQTVSQPDPSPPAGRGVEGRRPVYASAPHTRASKFAPQTARQSSTRRGTGLSRYCGGTKTKHVTPTPASPRGASTHGVHAVECRLDGRTAVTPGGTLEPGNSPSAFHRDYGMRLPGLEALENSDHDMLVCGFAHGCPGKLPFCVAKCVCLRPPRCVSTGPVVVRLAEMVLEGERDVCPKSETPKRDNFPREERIKKSQALLHVHLALQFITCSSSLLSIDAHLDHEP